MGNRSADQVEEGDHEWIRGTPIRSFGGLPAAAMYFLLLVINFMSLRWIWFPRWKNKLEARAELERIVAEHAHHDYTYWSKLIDHKKSLEFTTERGTWFQASIQPFWDDQSGGVIRVMFDIDDGGITAFIPMSYHQLVEPRSVRRVGSHDG